MGAYALLLLLLLQVGPATFFSAKQFEVFDVELLAIKTCTRSTSGMFSTVSCN